MPESMRENEITGIELKEEKESSEELSYLELYCEQINR